MSEKQRTLAGTITYSGKGLHTGTTVNMNIKPAQVGFGIKFSRVDLENAPLVEALAENVKETSRSTVIEKKGVRISTVEHLMAALWGCGIDNALVEVDAAEVPICDGSAAVWVKLIEQTGAIEQDADRVYYRINEKISYSNPEKGVELVAYPDDSFSVNVNVDFNSKVVGKQYATLDQVEEFVNEVAPCRTFVFLHEIEPLINGNLIKGGDLDNAIVIVEHPLSSEKAAEIAAKFHSDCLGADRQGYLTGELRFDNEIARHKMLDLLGDLALIGVRLEGKIFASRPGHKANNEFAKLIRKAIKNDESKPKYKYDPNAVPVKDISEIKRLLPHRPPFLLVDKIMHIDGSSVIGVKQVTMNEPFFIGHFPDKPVMPGVLIVEAMAQCGGILALSSIPDPENYLTFFMKIDAVKFKRQVLPGDTLLFMLELMEPIRRGIVHMAAKAYVGDLLVTEAELMAMITKDKKQ